MVVGIFAMIFIACISVYTLRLLIFTGKKVGVEDYERLCRYCFGNYGYYALAGSVLIFDIGACLTYSIIIGTETLKKYSKHTLFLKANIPNNMRIHYNNILLLSFYCLKTGDNAHSLMNHMLGWDSFHDRQIVIAVIYVMLILPFCLGKDFKFIEKISACAITVAVFLTIVVIIEYLHTYMHVSSNIVLVEYSLGTGPFFAALGTIAFAFVQHDQTFLVYKTLYNNTLQRYTELVVFSFSIQLMLCVTISVFGYLSFGAHTEQDILQNYGLHNTIIIVVRVVYTITVAFVYPTAFYVVRHMLYSMIFYNNEETFENSTMFWHLIFTFVPLSMFALISLWITNLGFIMSLTGLMSAFNIAFILPCACYLKVGEYPICFWNANSGQKCNAFMDVVPKLMLIIFGFVAAIVGCVQLGLNL